MAVTHQLYGPAMGNIAKNLITDLTSTATIINVHLMTSAHSVDQDNEYWATIAANESSAGTTGSTSYTVKTLDGKAISYATRVTTLTATSETVFTTGGDITAYYAVLAASSYLLSCVNFDGEEKSVAGEFKINWTDAKIATITVAT
jgi:hypothetical protein